MGSPEFSPKGISVDAVRSRPIGLAIPGNKEAPSVNEERTQAQDDASSYSGKKAKKATNEVSCPSFSFKKPSFTLSHLGRRAEQATGGTLSLTSVTDRFPLLFDSSGKTRENKKGLWPSFFRPGSLSPFTHVGKNAEQDIKDGVSLSSLAGKLPVSPGHSRKKLSGEKRKRDSKSKSTDIQATPAMYSLNHSEKYPSNCPKLEAVWSGSVEVLNMALPGKFSGDFRAHLPRCPWVIDHRAYKLSKQMPEVLQFELLPRGNIWDEIFDNDFAFSCDISLYFFPGNLERSIHQFDYLWSLMEKEDLVMRSRMDDFELIVFTSMRLCYAKELKWTPFLWGVFQFAKDEHISTSISNKKISTSTSNSNLSETHDSEVGTTSKQPSMKKTIRMIHLEVPPGFSREHASKGALKASFDVSNLVEVPVRNDPDLSLSLANNTCSARHPTSLKRKRGKPNKRP